MANTVTTQVILDGPRNAVIKVTGFVDTSNLASTTIIDPALLAGIDNTGTIKAAKFRILELNYNIEDLLTAILTWDATTPVVFDSGLAGRGKIEGKRYGGLTNNAATAGRTGKLLLTTQGWTAGAILSFTLVFEIIKEQT